MKIGLHLKLIHQKILFLKEFLPQIEEFLQKTDPQKPQVKETIKELEKQHKKAQSSAAQYDSGIDLEAHKTSELELPEIDELIDKLNALNSQCDFWLDKLTAALKPQRKTTARIENEAQAIASYLLTHTTEQFWIHLVKTALEDEQTYVYIPDPTLSLNCPEDIVEVLTHLPLETAEAVTAKTLPHLSHHELEKLLLALFSKEPIDTYCRGTNLLLAKLIQMIVKESKAVLKVPTNNCLSNEETFFDAVMNLCDSLTKLPPTIKIIFKALITDLLSKMDNINYRQVNAFVLIRIINPLLILTDQTIPADIMVCLQALGGGDETKNNSRNPELIKLTNIIFSPNMQRFLFQSILIASQNIPTKTEAPHPLVVETAKFVKEKHQLGNTILFHKLTLDFTKITGKNFQTEEDGHHSITKLLEQLEANIQAESAQRTKITEGILSHLHKLALLFAKQELGDLLSKKAGTQSPRSSSVSLARSPSMPIPISPRSMQNADLDAIAIHRSESTPRNITASDTTPRASSSAPMNAYASAANSKASTPRPASSPRPSSSPRLSSSPRSPHQDTNFKALIKYAAINPNDRHGAKSDAMAIDIIYKVKDTETLAEWITTQQKTLQELGIAEDLSNESAVANAIYHQRESLLKCKAALKLLSGHIEIFKKFIIETLLDEIYAEKNLQEQIHLITNFVCGEHRLSKEQAKPWRAFWNEFFPAQLNAIETEENVTQKIRMIEIFDPIREADGKVLEGELLQQWNTLVAWYKATKFQKYAEQSSSTDTPPTPAPAEPPKKIIIPKLILPTSPKPGTP